MHNKPGVHFNLPAPGIPSPIAAIPKGPVRVKGVTGGITDKNQIELLQLGNKVIVLPAATSASALGFTTLWVNGSDEQQDPRISNKGTVLQARSAVPDHPKNLDVNINPPFIDSSNVAIWADIKVRASWGVGADRCTAVVDVVNGAQFSVVATELVLEGLYTLIDLQGGTAPNLQIGANIGEYTRAGSSFGPSFTSYILSSGAGKVQNVAVPSYAKAVTIYPAVAAGNASVAITIGFIIATAAAGSFVSITQAANGCPCTYPLPNSVVGLKLTFPNATDTALVRFDLAL